MELGTDAAAMAMSPTRPTPIISAAAVDEVRLGLRSVFSLGEPPRDAPEAGDRPADDADERAPGSGRAR